MAGARFQIAQGFRCLTPEAKGLTALHSAMAQGQSVYARAALSAAAEEAQWLYTQTSGSSQSPKLVKRSPASWIASFEVMRDMLGITGQARVAVLGGLHHSLPLYASVEAMHLGASLAVLGGRGPKAQVQALEAMQASHIYATPTQLRLVCKAQPKAMSHVQHIMVGGGKLDTALAARLQTVFPGAQVQEFYGTSESSFITISDANTPQGSVGRAYPGVSLRIGTGFPAHETGEIWVQSPYLFEGYAEGAAPDTQWQGDWLSVGEMGYLDAQGYMFLKGRKSRMVTVADQNVFPEDVEAVLMAHLHVQNSAVLALPDAMRGAQIVGFVEGEVALPELQAHCRRSLPPHAVPRHITVVDSLPRLASGKVDLKALEQTARAAT